MFNRKIVDEPHQGSGKSSTGFGLLPENPIQFKNTVEFSDESLNANSYFGNLIVWVYPAPKSTIYF